MTSTGSALAEEVQQPVRNPGSSTRYTRNRNSHRERNSRISTKEAINPNAPGTDPEVVFASYSMAASSGSSQSHCTALSTQPEVPNQNNQHYDDPIPKDLEDKSIVFTSYCLARCASVNDYHKYHYLETPGLDPAKQVSGSSNNQALVSPLRKPPVLPKMRDPIRNPQEPFQPTLTQAKRVNSNPELHNLIAQQAVSRQAAVAAAAAAVAASQGASKQEASAKKPANPADMNPVAPSSQQRKLRPARNGDTTSIQPKPLTETSKKAMPKKPAPTLLLVSNPTYTDVALSNQQAPSPKPGPGCSQKYEKELPPIPKAVDERYRDLPPLPKTGDQKYKK